MWEPRGHSLECPQLEAQTHSKKQQNGGKKVSVNLISAIVLTDSKNEHHERL